jgi:hypothetical protein
LGRTLALGWVEEWVSMLGGELALWWGKGTGKGSA